MFNVGVERKARSSASSALCLLPSYLYLLTKTPAQSTENHGPWPSTIDSKPSTFYQSPLHRHINSSTDLLGSFCQGCIRMCSRNKAYFVPTWS